MHNVDYEHLANFRKRLSADLAPGAAAQCMRYTESDDGDWEYLKGQATGRLNPGGFPFRSQERDHDRLVRSYS